MMSTAFHSHQRDVIPRILVCTDDTIQCDYINRVIAVSSPNSVVLIDLSVLSSAQSFHHPCLSLMNVPGCAQLSMLPICPVSFPAVKTHQFHPVQETVPFHLIQLTSIASCASNMIPSTSHSPQPCRSIQLFIKSIRNMTISIHIASTSSISDLKHLIYAHDGITPCDIRLMHRDRELRDDALLSGLDVDGATITCLLRVLGGIPRNHRIPLRWWFGFSRSYEDGRAGEEYRIRHVLSEIEFGGPSPVNWRSDLPLSRWMGIRLYSGDEIGIFSLYLKAKCIISLPNMISSLKSLSRLDVSDNLLTCLPDSIGGITSLTDLNIHNNQLTNIPDSIRSLSCLTYLNVGNNDLTHLPDSIGNLTSLTQMDFYSNKLSHLPDSICNLSSLKILNLSWNKLTCLPASMGNLTALTSLDVRDNQLKRLPESIGSLSYLATLNVGCNQLTTLPDSIGNLTSLTQLYIDKNQLIFLPESFGNLSSLYQLYANNNKLTQLPDSIGNLSHLDRLDVGNNQLVCFPESIGNLNALRHLYAYNNPITLSVAGQCDVRRRFNKVGLYISVT